MGEKNIKMTHFLKIIIRNMVSHLNMYRKLFMVGPIINSFWHFLPVNQASDNYFVKILYMHLISKDFISFQNGNEAKKFP